MNRKPEMCRKQHLTDVTCVYNSYCNFYQLKLFSQKQFEDTFKIYWENLPSTQRMSAERQQSNIKAFIGASGYSADVLKLMLHARNQQFRELGNYDLSVNFQQFVLDLTNGFLMIHINPKKPGGFRHTVCVKNGYLMDPIGGKIYPWKGKIEHYGSVPIEIYNAIDCDQATVHQLAKAGESAIVIIDSDED